MTQPPLTAHSARLRGETLGFPSILMQAITHIAPAVGLVLTIQMVASLAGRLAPMAYALAFLIVLTLGVSLGQLAKHHPSAGGYYTYIARTIHPRAGFLTAWLYFLYDPAATALNLAFMGFFFETMLRTQLGLVVPWWGLFIPAVFAITWLTYRGIEVSVSTMIWLSLAEVTIFLALSFTGLMHPGAGGVNFDSFRLDLVPARNGFSLAVVFSIFAFTGFESVAPLAEESRDPQTNLPRSIFWSIILTGIFFVFIDWALLIGWGSHNIASLIRAPENPAILLAQRLWGRGWILVCVAVVNSILGVSIAATNAATRVFYAMGRSGALPVTLAHIHPRYRTPVHATWLQTALTLLIGLGIGIAVGPETEYLFLGLMMTLALILIYSFGNIGVFLCYFRDHRDEFNIVTHLVFPLVSTIALLWVGYTSVITMPTSALRYAPFVVTGWLVLGTILAKTLPSLGRKTDLP